MKDPLFSNTGDGQFEPFYCNDKYFSHWIQRIQWKHFGKTQLVFGVRPLKLCLHVRNQGCASRPYAGLSFRKVSGRFNSNSNGADTAYICKHSACLHTQQESIPVGCIPSAAVAARGVSAWGMSAEGGCICPGEVSAWVVCLGGMTAWEVSAWGVSARHPLPCEQNDWQMPVKILPCHNFIADGKNVLTMFQQKLHLSVNSE